MALTGTVPESCHGVCRGSRPRLGAAALLALMSLAPCTASGQEWYELYAEGVKALRGGEARRAVELLRSAIRERPRPGLDILTYGTNFEARYFPYLRLAEAQLALGNHPGAREALESSARFGIEPAEERDKLETRLAAALETKAAAPSVQAPTPTPVVATLVVPSTVAATPAPPPPSTPPPVALPVQPPASAPRPAGPREPPPLLEITSDPPGARVFVDDEPVGRTDRETGRLRLTDLSAGRHRLRLSHEGRQDLFRELDLAAGTLRLEAVLPPLASPEPSPSAVSSPTTPAAAGAPAQPPWALYIAVGILVALTGWLWARSLSLRSPRLAQATLPTATRSPRPGESGAGEGLPTSFGEYTLLRCIGRGGMATVYEATRRGETFALKRPLAALLDDELFRERFLREAELGRTLHHPNIVRIFDRGVVGETPYFAMELVPGETLRALLDREGPLDVLRAARVTAQVAEALDYAHHKGVIHRDLKPSNIMLEPSGEVKVMDYGIARAQHLEGLTTTGTFLGTPYYAAPETVDGVAHPRSDLYSLGVVLFEMLTGSVPFQGDNAFVVMRRHCDRPPPVPSSLRRTVSVGLDRIVLRLLSKDPADRPSAEDLLNALADHVAEAG